MSAFAALVRQPDMRRPADAAVAGQRLLEALTADGDALKISADCYRLLPSGRARLRAYLAAAHRDTVAAMAAFARAGTA